MGRYAFFSTGLEYKFRFGVQDSNDITLFGGESSFTDSQELSHHWKADEKTVVEEKLKALLDWLGEPPVDFAAYEPTIEGTWKMKSDLFELFHKEHDEKIVSQYILGSLIYHQLMYEDCLQADYEG